MWNRDQESFGGLPWKGAATGICYCPRYHHRQPGTCFFKSIFHGKHGRLGVKCIEDCFYEQDIHATINQSFGLLLVAFNQLIEANGTKTGVVHIRRHGGRFTGWPQRTGHKPGFVRVLMCEFPGSFFGDFSRSLVHLINHGFHFIVGHRNACGIKGIGFYDVGPGFKVLLVYLADYVGTGDRKQIVAAF